MLRDWDKITGKSVSECFALFMDPNCSLSFNYKADASTRELRDNHPGSTNIQPTLEYAHGWAVYATISILGTYYCNYCLRQDLG